MVVGLVRWVDDVRKELGGDAGATIERADLRVVDNGAEVVFRAGGGIGTGFAREVNGKGDTSAGVLCVIGPGVDGSFTRPFLSPSTDGRVARPLQPPRPLLTDSHSPVS